jgi:hypothetical protein
MMPASAEREHMSCPVHIWVPVMAALVPVARVGRERVKAWTRLRRASKREASPRPVQRFAPVGSTSMKSERQAPE